MKDPFEYQAPTPAQVTYIQETRLAMQRLARLLDSVTMDARCRALAKTKLEECSMWVNKGIVFAEEQS